MSPHAIALLVLLALTLLALFLKSRKTAALTGNGEVCAQCQTRFPLEMLETVKHASANQLQQTLQKFPGQNVNVKLKVKMTCPQCRSVTEIAIPAVS